MSGNIDLGLALVAVLREPGVEITCEDLAAWCDCAPSTIHRIERRALEKIRWSAQNPVIRSALLEGMEKPAKAGPASPFKYKPQFGVIVICESEPDQKKKFALLKKQGLKLKVVSV